MKKLNLVRTIILAGTLLLQLSTLCFHSRGAAGDVDLSFDPGSGVNGAVQAVVVQPDGKVIIGGKFTTVKGLVRTNLARLNADGSGDSSFNVGSTAIDASGYVASLALQSDGKMLIAVAFANYEGYVARLNSDGTVDTSFNPVTDAPAFCVALQPDGKVCIGGGFTTVNGTNRNGIARLNADGSLDTSFDPGNGPDGQVRSITLQSDGKVLIGGWFIKVNGTNRPGIARLNASGTLDGSFNPDTSFPIYSVALQADGKVLIGGNPLTVNGTNRNGIARLNADGSLDSSFNAGTEADSQVFRIALQPDGKVLIVGWFNDVPRTRRIARLNANGSLDSSFNGAAVVSDGSVYPIALLPDGKVLIGGDFFTVNEIQRSSIARLNTNGTLDGSFQPGKRMDISFSTLIALPDSKVLINGFVHGTNQIGSVRLNPNGSLDRTFISASFNPDLGLDPNVDREAVITVTVGQSNGKVFLGGYYILWECDDVQCTPFYTLFFDRFNADGSRDTQFERTSGETVLYTANPEFVKALAVQPDGKVVVGGYFSSIKGTNRKGLARLNADGSLDSTFNPISGVNGPASIALQPDGKVLIAVPGIAIARLNADGIRDHTFNTGYDGSSIALQPDGKVLIGGAGGGSWTLRLNSNGSLDSNFNFGTGADGVVRSIALQSDGNILICGDFLTVNGVLRPHVARLFGDFDPTPNLAPSVSISSPANGSSYAGPAIVEIDVDATDSDGSVARVDFYAGDTLLASDSSAPFAISWEDVPAGDYSLTADATDNRGATSTSAAVNISVTNTAPLVSISGPVSGSTFEAPATIAITVDASDSDGTIAQVDVYAGDTFLGSDDSAPFEVTWNNVSPGNYTITADASDNLGATTRSLPVNIIVTAPSVPLAPSGLTATAVSRKQIRLSWTDNAANEVGGKIERSTNGKPFKQIATVGTNVTSFSNTGLTRGNKYAYRLRAYNSIGDSPYSNTATARTGRRLPPWLPF